MGDKSDAKDRQMERERIAKEKAIEANERCLKAEIERNRKAMEKEKQRLAAEMDAAQATGHRVIPILATEVSCPAGAARLTRYKASKCMQHPIIQELLKHPPRKAREYRHGTDMLMFDGKYYHIPQDATEQNEQLLLCATKLKDILSIQSISYLTCRSCNYYRGEVQKHLMCAFSQAN